MCLVITTQRATHLPKPHITRSEVCEREKLKAGRVFQGSSLSASKICNCNQSPDARAGFCAVLFNFCPHTHTSPVKHQYRLHRKTRAKSYERSFFLRDNSLKSWKSNPLQDNKIYFMPCISIFNIFTICFSIVHYENVIECNESHNSKANFVESYIV